MQPAYRLNALVSIYEQRHYALIIEVLKPNFRLAKGGQTAEGHRPFAVVLNSHPQPGLRGL